MSVHVTSAVWRLQLDVSEKIVLLKLADCADDDGKNAYPSVRRVAAECCLSERTVQRVLRSLEEQGIIAVQQGHDRAAHRPTTYQLHPERGDTVTPRPGDTRDASRVTSTTSPGDTGDTRSVLNRQKNQQQPEQRARERVFAVDFYVDLFGREPNNLIREELSNADVGHPPECIEWAFRLTAGLDTPNVMYLRRIFNGCLAGKHGPRESNGKTERVPGPRRVGGGNAGRGEPPRRQRAARSGW